MSADGVSDNFEHLFSETYRSELKLTNLLNYQKKKLITPIFSASAYLDAKFCFEVVFSEYTSNGYLYWLVKLILIKLDGSSVPSSVKLDIDMKVQHLDGTLIKEYSKLPVITVEDMDYYYFDEIHLSYKCNSALTESGLKLNESQTLKLKIQMMFSGHLENLLTTFLSPQIICSLNTEEKSSGDIKSFERSDEFSNIIIRVASQLFFAHTALLAQHSPVFERMITQKQDNESLLGTDDKSPSAFDSFLNYLYSGSLEDTSWPMVRDVYILSVKYKVDALKAKCRDAIVLHLSVDTVSEVLKIAYDYDDSKLKEPAITLAVEHIKDVSSSEEWKEFIASHPRIGYEVIFSALKIANI